MRPHTAFWSWTEPEHQQVIVKSIENRGDRVAFTVETAPPWMGSIEDVQVLLPDRKRMAVRALARGGQGRFTIEAEGNLDAGDWFSVRIEPAWAVVEVREG